MSTIGNATFKMRLEQSRKQRAKNPNAVLVVTLKGGDSMLPESMHNKLYLVPRDLSVLEFSTMVRKQAGLDRSKAMSMFTGGKVLVTPDSMVGLMYDRFCEDDGILYVLCTDQSAFG